MAERMFWNGDLVTLSDELKVVLGFPSAAAGRFELFYASVHFSIARIFLPVLCDSMSSHDPALQCLSLGLNFPRDHSSLSFQSHSFSAGNQMYFSWRSEIIPLSSLLLSFLACQAFFCTRWWENRKQVGAVYFKLGPGRTCLSPGSLHQEMGVAGTAEEFSWSKPKLLYDTLS